MPFSELRQPMATLPSASSTAKTLFEKETVSEELEKRGMEKEGQLTQNCR
jgi:hypothetical protein